MIILDYFLLNEPQFSTALFTGLFLLLSSAIGFVLRRQWIEGGAWGFLILAGSADLAIFISRTVDLPTTIFGLLVLAVSAIITFVLRTSFFPPHQQAEEIGKMYVAVLVVLGGVVWAGNILHPMPNSGFSSHHGWVPLYIQESFSLGRFINIEDTAFGEGVMTALYYPADLLGLVALSGWLGADEVYPAFNAGSIAATLLMFGVLARSLRKSPEALVFFFILTMVMFGFDPFFRTVLGGNWGDVLMYLGGALICYYLSQCERTERAIVLAATASVFLVFSRHYGAFYSAIIIASCFFISWGCLRQRSFKPWLIIGGLWSILSFRELYYIFGQFTKYYPGSWVVERRPLSLESHFLGALNDWGLIGGTELSLSGISFRALYILVLAFVLWKMWPQIKQQNLLTISIISPMLVLLAPLALQIVSGYRNGGNYSKLYILGIFFFAWYPSFLLMRLASHGGAYELWHKIKMPLLAGCFLVIVSLGALFSHQMKPERFISGDLAMTLDKLFEDNIVDRDMVARLREELYPEEIKDVISSPIMYVYFEPGTSIRLYLGGEFMKDLDFWSTPVGEQAKNSSSMSDLLEKLNYPNIYIGLMPKGKISGYPDAVRRKFIAEIEQVDTAIWLKKVVKVGSARFYVVRKPAV